MSGRRSHPSNWTSDAVIKRVALEVEAHVAAAGWDQPPRLYALVPTSELLVAEPALAARLGLDAASAAGSFTPIEQDNVPVDRPLEETLQQIIWPPRVAGCATVMERLVLPSQVEHDLPVADERLDQEVADDPRLEEVRVVAAATRDGRAHCAVRMRTHDRDDLVLDGLDLVPGLVNMLWRTLAD